VPAFDLDAYRDRAETFLREIDREYLLHLSGRKPELAVAPFYEQHAELFARDAVAKLRELAADAQGEERRRLRYLTQFALDGAIGQATKHEAEELARLEASLELEFDGAAVPFRQVPVLQANEPHAERRAELERGRNELIAERLDPLYRAALERAHELCRELGWRSYAAAYGELRGLDFERLREQTDRLLETTAAAYPSLLEPQLARAGVPELGALARSDVPRLMRAPSLDAGFPGDRLVASFAETLAGLGLDLAAQDNVHFDTEARPSKSPRAFCSTPRVPEEVHLVVLPVGGREDFAALFHEGGHVEHYANTAAELPFEFRHLGDNGVTESFAFLFEHLTDDPAWLEARLGVGDAGEIRGQARATRLLMLRRYCAKLAYELELHAEGAKRDALPARYAALLSDATSAKWPRETWLADVDEGFYVVCYLRAWALEAHWRRALRARHGERWFEQPAAGAWLRKLWAGGQRLDAEELLAEVLGEELDFELLLEDLV